ncbi:Phage tail fibre repeat [Serratia marcescens]|uniref:phage tail-collar fiber domain-containing protein n=2 Tax=Serratia marcescens TaxID=615 RepID=UPI0007450743|nr:phage tail protein [Serratia marcescens]MBI6174370.1 phage tail protein [Serratia marcescens]CUY36436.1 Phage tail fibre repeat [Serratia marcescens]CUY38503.1 Phage tail fibre repeat [Serratia marcescens]CUY40350.1 Phage tail fibre repeat [Serratia marcescens]CUZ15014.1 Phage tail fibre repeat [Serratia marcescens]
MNKYKAIITTAGAAKIAAASAGGTQLKIVSMAVGDGNGTLPTPNPAQTKLVNEKYRAVLNGLTIDKALKNHILAEMIIPANVGGFWLREMGLYDEAGMLIAVSNMAESYKPKLEEGSGRTQTLRMILIVSSTEAIQVIAGGDTVLATKDYVTDAITAHEKTRNHPDASTTAKGLVQLSSATTSTDETKASTPKALKAVNDASMKKAANLSDLTDKAAARGNLALGTAATKNVGVDGGQLMEVGAFGLGSGSRHREDAYCNQAEIYRVNSSSKNTPGGDVYGVLSLPCDGGPSGAYMAVQNNGNAFFGRSNIPSNGVVWFQAYTTKFKPTAADVGAWSKTESDGRFVKQTGDTMKGALTLPRIVFPNENTANADDDLNRENGFTVESLVATVNKGYPVPGGMGVLFTGKVNEFRNVQFAVGSGDLAFYLRSMRKDSAASLRWARVYTTDYKPTAADVGALTDAQAAQKYALRSIKVNGKPLSADVKLLAGDVNAWNKTEADGRYLAKTGGQLTGTLKTSAEIQSTHIDNYRMVGGGFGSFWRNDGNRLYLLLTKENDQYGTFNNLRPFSVDVRTGAAAFESGMHIGGNWPAITTSSGTTWHPDGNVQGSCWGGYLSNWLNQNISAAQNNAQNWAYQHLVQGVRMAGRTVIADTGGRIDLPSGCVYTGMSGSNYNPSIWGAYSAVQVLINGTWATIGTV